MWRDVSGGHEVRDAPRDRAGFAGPRTGQHAHGPTGGEDGLALFVVEIAEEFVARRGGHWSLEGHADHLYRAGRQTRAAGGHVGGIRYVERLMSAALTMYTTSWCGYCFRLKKVLKAEGIRFTEVDIETDPAAAEFVASVNGGNQTVPTVKFADGSTLTNPSGAEVKAKLAS
jgi:mycoredoxin